MEVLHEREAALARELAEQKRKEKGWQETVQKTVADVEVILASQREFEQTMTASHRQETDELRRQIAELAEQRDKLSAANEQSTALAEATRRAETSDPTLAGNRRAEAAPRSRR